MAATLKASLTPPILSKSSSSTRAVLPKKTQLRKKRWVSLVLRRNGGKSLVCCCSATTNEEVGILEEEQGQDGYLVRGFGWGVRRMVTVGDEMKRVAQVQAEAFHVPVAIFNDFFFQFFLAEVLSALIYRVKNSPPDRYACLVAESEEGSNSRSLPELVGVVDVTVQRDADVLRHLGGTREYVYVSGIAVLTKFRRQKIATVMLEACDVLSRQLGFNHLALRAYEEDSAAQKLYSKAGYRVVSVDPDWMTLIGRKKRVLMIKQFTSQSTSNI